VNRISKAAIAILVSAVALGLGIAHVLDLHVNPVFRRAASFAGLVESDPVEKGRDAFSRGDFATALQLWRSLADQGNSAAQHALGVAYERGNGVFAGQS
jgi:TPR repeat protein